MELLDAANTGAYGHPVPTKVRIEPVKGKAIVVSGHDLKDLEELLKQTEGKGINVYTHGEMLPAHGYPELKKYKHLVGNYGGAWQDQVQGVRRLPRRDPDDHQLHPEAARGLQGPHLHHGAGRVAGRDARLATRTSRPSSRPRWLPKGSPRTAPDKTITVGFGHDAVMGVAGTVIEAVKSGAIRHFFLIGGCDGAKPGRNYYTEFAQAGARRLRDPDAGVREVSGSTSWTSATSAASRGCWTSASATTPTRRSRSRSRWRRRSRSASTTCRCR